MGNAHRGDHDIAFYEATVGETLDGTTSAPASPVFINSDGDGPLRPARYLIQVASVSVDGVVVWVGFSKFEKGDSASTIAAAGPKRIPLSQSTIIAIETNVLEGEDDRLTIESTGGTATVYATRISTVVAKGALS